MSDYAGDPLARRFDHTVALVAYGLLFISVFTFWIPAVIAAGIAYTHKRGADWRTAGHFRFQLLIFWVSVALGALGLALWVAAGGFAISAVLAYALDNELLVLAPATAALLIGGIAAFVVGGLWTVGASLWGAFRLATDRPIGQSAAGNPLDIR